MTRVVCTLLVLVTCRLSVAAEPAADANPFPADAPMPSYGRWTSSRFGGGGYIQNVVPTGDPNVYYAYVDVGGLYRSDDACRSWRMLHGALPPRPGNYQVRGLVADPRDADHIVVATGSNWDREPEGVYVSTDGGKSFERTLQTFFAGNGDHRPEGFVLARHPREPDVLLAGSMGGGAYRSDDNGRTWAKSSLPDGVNVTDVRFDAADPSRAYLCALRWSGHLGGKPDQRLTGGFYRSADGGRTWGKLADESPTEIVQDRRDPSRLYGIFDNARIRLSTDAGETWRDFSDGLPVAAERPEDNTSERKFSALAAGPDFVLTASARGTFYRLDAGADRWEKVERQQVNEGDWYARMREGYHQHFGSALGSITIDPRDPQHWFFTDWYAVYESPDAGRSWTLRINGIEVTVIHQLLQDPSDASLVHLGMADNGYLRSTDGGRTFAQVSEGISNNIKDLALAPKDPSRLYAVGPKTHEWYANQVFVSDDKGLSWTRSPMTGLPDMEQARCNTIAVHPGDPTRVYLAVSGAVKPGGGGPYVSTDGGRTWKWIGAGLPQGKGFYRESIWHGGCELAVGPDGTVLTGAQEAAGAYRLAPGAREWARVDARLGGNPFNVAADPLEPGRFYAVSRGGGISVSADAGVTWRRTFEPGAGHVVADAAVPGRAAADTADGVVLSTDGGQTWRPLDPALPHRVNGNMPAFAGDHLVVGSDGSGTFWTALKQ